MADPIAVKFDDGVELEVVARKRNAAKPHCVHAIDLDAATATRLKAALKKAYKAPSK